MQTIVNRQPITVIGSSIKKPVPVVPTVKSPHPPIQPPPKPDKYYVTLCLIVKDDKEYLQEWLDYHILIGVEHFYIYDHNTKPPHRDDVLKEYINSGWVTYTYETRPRPIQVPVYNECRLKYGPDSTWLGYIDSDEFILLKKHDTIQELMRHYEQYGSVSIAWNLYGSNGHTKKQASMIRSYTTASKREDRQCKSISRSDRVDTMDHHIVLACKDGYKRVNLNGVEQKVHHLTSDDDHNIAVINHYVTRSLEDYKIKLARGGGHKKNVRSMKFYDIVHQLNDRTDTTIINNVQRLLSQRPLHEFTYLRQLLA